MMPLGSLVRMVFANTLRSPRHFALSVFGIVMGIASFVFFLSLSLGVRDVILGKIFPIQQVQVVAPRMSMFGKDMSKKLDDKIVETIRKQSSVAEALPRMHLVFPASGSGNFEGQEVKFEVGGFGDGIDPTFLADDPKLAELFKDWDKEEPNRTACVPPRIQAQLDAQQELQQMLQQAQQAAAPGAPGQGAAPAPQSPPAPPAPRKKYKNPCPHPERYYCDETDRTCHHRVPVIVSPTLLELYNGQFASSHGLPVIGELEQFIVQRGGLGRMRFEIGLGDTMVAGSNTEIAPSKRRNVEGMLIGISPKAMPIGMTMPIGYIERWNREFVGGDAASTYSSIIVTLRDKDELAPFSQWLQDDLDLRLEDSLGERFATAIFIVTTLFVLISFVIVGISAINIAHNFFMQVSERRREIGVLRAVGAGRLDVRLIILGEAALIGLFGGVVGILLARGAGAFVDWASVHYLPRFPFKPDTYFVFHPWILLGGLLFSTVFCVLGGFLPARKASLLEPAQALAQN